ncbi:hypothetical protein [Bacillus licheniformis]|jgi:hypothetical protein|uniref:hypothetical protein n=1 Tax=Bacillus licheniformis TaxID=1402 RepID=UPI00237CB255|nr:hypothetical protein [Bacillus licheniformis]MDE1407087.1 hypothetical protein [Bacillus licheniformis]
MRIRMRASKSNKDKLMSELNTFIDDLIDHKDYLSEQVKNFNAEEKVAKALKEVEEVKRASLYVMNDQENRDAEEFIEKHCNSCKSNIQYILEGTGMGTVISIKCKKCNEVKNITDDSNW